MTLLMIDSQGLLTLIIGAYLVLHLPAFILLIIGLLKRKSKPELSQKLLILAVIYFVVGAGICGGMLL